MKGSFSGIVVWAYGQREKHAPTASTPDWRTRSLLAGSRPLRAEARACGGGILGIDEQVPRRAPAPSAR